MVTYETTKTILTDKKTLVVVYKLLDNKIIRKGSYILDMDKE